jgi:chemotaxis protein MotA
MHIMILMGLALSVITLFYGVPDLWDNAGVYLDGRSFLFVFGGALGATMISITPKEFLSIIKILTGYMFITSKALNNYDVVYTLIEISEVANRSGKEAVLDMGKALGDGFLDRALVLMGAGLERSFVQTVLETDIFEEKSRHAQMIVFIRTMGSSGPMFGMLGTVMGIMKVLQNVTDIDSVVSGMGLALLTTMYGLILSAVYFIPLANRLKRMNDENALTKEIIMEGVLAIMDDNIPLMVEKKLLAYLQSKDKRNKKEVKR